MGGAWVVFLAANSCSNRVFVTSSRSVLSTVKLNVSSETVASTAARSNTAQSHATLDQFAANSTTSAVATTGSMPSASSLISATPTTSGGISSVPNPVNPVFVTRSGRQLMLGNKPFRFIGSNRYGLAGGAGTQGCLQANTAADYTLYFNSHFQAVASSGMSVVCFWAFQGVAGLNGSDFTFLDQVIAIAKANGVCLVPVLENNWDDCTAVSLTEGAIKSAWSAKDAPWFQSGYNLPYGTANSPSGVIYTLSMTDWVKGIVGRYRDEPTIAFWEIINEGTEWKDPTVLSPFLENMAKLIKSIDPNHLVAARAHLQRWQLANSGPGQQQFQDFNSDPSIDIVDFHDYNFDADAWPACAAAGLVADHALGKPMVTGEVGVAITDAEPPIDRATRAQYL